MNQTAFSALNLSPALVNTIASLGYQAMTPIQAQSLPQVLGGKDLIGQAKTGSGKTAVFALGLLSRLDSKNFQVQALVLCPTRELADQVANEIRRLARAIPNVKVLTLCGGMPFGPQLSSLKQGAHVVVGTPGRLEEHLRKGSLWLGSLSTFVLDEADRMLDMGFQEALDAIIEHVPKERQTLLFSATYPDEIKIIAERIMVEPALVQVASTHDNASIQQHFFELDARTERLTALRILLLNYRPASALVFCNTKRETQQVAEGLIDYGFSALALHGDLEQRDRDETLLRFANKSVAILVATDVAARGLDIDALEAVINYQMAGEIEVHVHRIGRTGRAGSKGIACTLVREEERYKIARLEEYLDQSIAVGPLPSLSVPENPICKPAMLTLQINGGKKQKLRPGDILGALTGDDGVAGDQVGKINIYYNRAYVAVSRAEVHTALHILGKGKLKGRSFRVRLIGD